MAQNGVRHILVAENNDLNNPMGIVTRSDLAAYLRANMDIDGVKANGILY